MKNVLYMIAAMFVVVALFVVDVQLGMAAGLTMVLGSVWDRNTAWEYHTIAVGTEKVGYLVQAQGLVWMPQFNRVPNAGDKIAYRRDRVVEIEKNAGADAYALGADVYFEPATGKALTGAGGTAFVAGKARKASGATDTTVFVGLNE